MPPTVSRIIQRLQPSATMAMAAKAKELKAAGNVIYDLSLGEPDFTAPQHICQAALRTSTWRSCSSSCPCPWP
jgi:aspartate aminotransferase